MNPEFKIVKIYCYGVYDLSYFINILIVSLIDIINYEDEYFIERLIKRINFSKYLIKLFFSIKNGLIIIITSSPFGFITESQYLSFGNLNFLFDLGNILL